MRRALTFLVAATILGGLCWQPAQANLITYTDQSSFLSSISNVGVDTYDDLPIGYEQGPYHRSAGAYTYTASALPFHFFNGGAGSDHWMGTNLNEATITFYNISAGVTGIGGFFFGAGGQSSYRPGESITIVATDGDGSVTQTITNATLSSFLGFTTDNAFTSLTVTAVQRPAPDYVWPLVNDLTFGSEVVTAVPEPGTLTLVGLGAIGMAYGALRRRRQPTARHLC